MAANGTTTADNRRKRDFTWLSPKLEVLIWVIITAFYFLRVLYLDADSAPWGVASYQPIDEGIYGNLALNLVNFGSMNPNDYYQGLYQCQMQAHTISGLFTNMVVFLFMKLFGDNYYGFRMGSVVVGYVVVLLFYLTLKEMARKAVHLGVAKGDLTAVGFLQDAVGRNRCLAAFACVAILLASFVFYDACRFVEPSIYRLLFVQAMIYCFVKETFGIRLKAFLIGFLWICSVFFVYITNVFVGIAILAYLIFLLVRHRSEDAKNYVLYGFLGLLSAYILALVYYGVMWSTSPLANLFSGVLIFQQQGYNNGNYEIAGTGLLQNFRAFFTSNIVLYDLPLIPIFFLSLPALYNVIFRENNEDVLFIFFVVVGLLLQTLVSQDFITRKALIVFPAILILLYVCINQFSKMYIEAKAQRFGFFILCLLAVAFVLYVAIFRMFLADGSVMTCLDYSETDVIVVALSACVVAILAILLFSSKITGASKLCSVIVGVLIGCCFAINGYFLFQYHMKDHSYSEKQIMIQLGDEFGSSVVTGDFVYGFTLYNDIHPLTNDPQVIGDYMRNDSSLYNFDYSGENTGSLNPKVLSQSLETVRVFKRTYRSFGYSRDVALYRWSNSGNDRPSDSNGL